MRIYNTMTKHVEPLEPLEPGHVRLYTCGPTVYDFAHIGNFRAYVWEDLLRRTLELSGFRVTQVMNITDIEDKIIRRMLDEKKSLPEVTEPFIRAFFEDIDTLRIERAEHYPRATDHVPEMLSLAEKLRDAGHTYESQGSLYFRIDSFEPYGKLSNLDRREIKVGARVDSDEYEKDDARDFVLWKGGASRPGEPSWDGPFGAGRPGWHLECSAMGMKYLGESFDLHTGGVDNIFPHHENEIAQSEAATGRPFVKYWMHVAHLMVDGQKMSKSKGNFYTLRDLLAEGHDPRAIRLLLMSTHYRSPLNFTQDALHRATSEVARLDDLVARLDREPSPSGESPDFSDRASRERRAFLDALENDLDISGAVGAVFRLVREANAAMDRKELPDRARVSLREALSSFDRVLGVLERETVSIDSEIEALIEKRDEARAEKNWAEADRIRDGLLERGIVLEDTPEGVRWKRRLGSGTS